MIKKFKNLEVNDIVEYKGEKFKVILNQGRDKLVTPLTKDGLTLRHIMFEIQLALPSTQENIRLWAHHDTELAKEFKNILQEYDKVYAVWLGNVFKGDSDVNVINKLKLKDFLN